MSSGRPLILRPFPPLIFKWSFRRTILFWFIEWKQPFLLMWPLFEHHNLFLFKWLYITAVFPFFRSFSAYLCKCKSSFLVLYFVFVKPLFIFYFVNKCKSSFLVLYFVFVKSLFILYFVNKCKSSFLVLYFVFVKSLFVSCFFFLLLVF